MRVGRIDGEFVVNPTYAQLKESELDLVVSGTRDAIMMVEAGAKLLTEDVMAEAILFGHRALQPLIDLQEQLQAQVGKTKRIPFIEPATDSVLDFVDAVAAGQPFVVFDLETTSVGRRSSARSSRSAPSRSRVARSPTAGRPSSSPLGPSSAPSCTASPTRTSRRRPSADKAVADVPRLRG